MRAVRPPRTCLARVLPAIVWGAAVLLVGCHGSTVSTPGTPVVTMGNLTDGASDFASYTISVDAITLTRSDGSVFTPLVTPQTIDFVKLNSMTELVEAPAVPAGTYKSASITIDYGAASNPLSPGIWLNLNGRPAGASLLTNTGTVPGAYSVTVTFDPNHPLVVTAGQSVRLQVDIDIAASSEVVTESPAVVAVQPFATMRAAPVDSTVMRARGLFVVVPTGSSIPAGTSGTFIMNVRPFYDFVSALGAVFVSTNAQTYWNINGVAYTGAAGLNALTPQQQGIPIVAYGTLDSLSGITPTFTATSVYVGTSQESPLAEYLTGVVAARSGDTLTLVGVTYLTPLGQQTYLASAPVVIGPKTIISEDGVENPNLTAASVSVGQQIRVSGQVGVNASTGALVYMDATGGQLRLQSTSVWGNPTAVGAGSVTLDVLSLGAFTTSNFKFDGTGSSASSDASPSAYAVNTGSLDTSAITAGTQPVQANGLAAPFGSAPPDFTATAITPGSSTVQTLVVQWTNGGSTAPFSSYNSAGLTVNLSDANLSTVHYIRTGPAELDLTTLSASPLITTVGADQSNLDLAVGSASLTTGVSVFQSAAAFDTGLKAALNGTNKVFRLVAYGQYNPNSNTFVASRIHVALEE